MSRMVDCQVLGESAEGLEWLPYPGELGQRIYDSVSKQGWQQWMEHQTRIINEYRMTPADPKARTFLEAEMEKFFFSGGELTETSYVPPEAGSSQPATDS